jgi:predicted ester cyclase
MSRTEEQKAMMAVVRRNTEVVQGQGDIVATYKTYHGTHRGPLFDIAPTGRTVAFETVDAMRVRDGRIVEHWGVANLFALVHQLGAHVES